MDEQYHDVHTGRGNINIDYWFMYDMCDCTECDEDGRVELLTLLTVPIFDMLELIVIMTCRQGGCWFMPVHKSDLRRGLCMGAGMLRLGQGSTSTLSDLACIEL